MPKFYECGICGHCHPFEWNGDCRDDANRFTNAALDSKYGRDGWEEVPMPTWEDDNPFHPESPEGRAWDDGDRSSIDEDTPRSRMIRAAGLAAVAKELAS